MKQDRRGTDDHLSGQKLAAPTAPAARRLGLVTSILFRTPAKPTRSSSVRMTSRVSAASQQVLGDKWADGVKHSVRKSVAITWATRHFAPFDVRCALASFGHPRGDSL